VAGWAWLAVRAGKSAFWKDLDAKDGWREGCGRHGWRGGRDVTVRRRAEACADEAEECGGGGIWIWGWRWRGEDWFAWLGLVTEVLLGHDSRMGGAGVSVRLY
jgi:hypothetical protein